MTDFATSDTHFWHTNIIKYCNRPFTSAAHMNEVLVEKWNSVVKPGDRVFHLGDFIVGFSGTVKDAEALVNRLNGDIYLISGNHEKVAKKIIPHKFKWIKPYYEYEGDFGTIIMFHYAQRVWRGSHKGNMHLYGHSHGDLPELPYELSFDIGVDSWDFTPVSMERIHKKMQDKLAARTEALKNGKLNLESGHHGNDR